MNNCVFFLEALGLCAGIIGGLLTLFCFFSPVTDIYDRSGIAYVFKIDPKKEKKVKIYDCLSRMGILLIIVGFLLQLIGLTIEYSITN